MIHTTSKAWYKYTKFGMQPGDIPLRSKAAVLEKQTDYLSHSMRQSRKSCALFRKEFYLRAQGKWRRKEVSQIQEQLFDEE